MQYETENYIVKSDQYNIHIEKKGISEKGKPTTKRITGYHSTYKKVLIDFAKTEFVSSDCKSVEEMLVKAQEIENSLVELTTKLSEKVNVKVETERKEEE